MNKASAAVLTSDFGAGGVPPFEYERDPIRRLLCLTAPCRRPVTCRTVRAFTRSIRGTGPVRVARRSSFGQCFAVAGGLPV